jgi:polyisoprenoid-binding protein YceI
MRIFMRAAVDRIWSVGLAAALAGLLCAPALAKPSAPVGTYKLDSDHTQIVFEIRHMGISTFFGRFGKISGAVNFDQAAPEKGALDVTIDMHDIETHLPGLDSVVANDLFQADKFPTATFTATKIEKRSDNTGVVTGDLTIAGVTRPVVLNVTFNGGRGSGEPMQPYRIGFDATATLKRSDFGLTHVIWTGFVADDVQLLIEAEAVRK